MSAQSDFYIANAERLIGKKDADELKGLLRAKRSSAFFTRADGKRLDELVMKLMTASA